MIPKVFHQIWLGPDRLPAEFEAYQESWRRHHPGWDLRLWGEDNLPADLRRPEVYDRERKPVERADILRLELIWRFGGVYVDTDFECFKPIDELLEGVEFFTGLMKRAGRSKPARVNNAIFGAVAGHPLLDRAVDELSVHEIGARYDKHLSGAMFFNALVIDDPGLTIFEPELFYPATELEREQAYGLHHAARMWHDVEGLRIIMLRAEKRLEKTTERLEKEQQLREREQQLREREQRLHELALQKLEDEKRALEEQLAKVRELGELAVLPEKQAGRGLDILFFLRSIHFDRVFEPFLRELCERGHALTVVLSTEKRGLPETKTLLFNELRARYDFAYQQLPPRNEPWLRTAVALRHALDYMRYLEPEFANAEPLRERARERAPWLVRTLLRIPLVRGRTGRRLLGWALRRLEAAIPVPREIRELVQARKPDVVLVSPLVGMGSTESELIRAAQELGIPTVLPVSSWDNLTNKGVLRDVPTTTIVWNDAQTEEAVRLHGLPREQVIAVGAHTFDHWLGRSTSTTREEFARTRGLDPERPLLLYLGSSYFISGDETKFMREWLGRVRADPRLADAAVILRPHPQNGIGWDTLEDEPGRTVVWPKTPTAPTDDEKRADYFDTLSHASAVVGINTTGLIEAAILHRPVFTLVSKHFTTQEGTLHFSYLSGDEHHGPVTVARGWDEHLDQLAQAIEGQAVDHERYEAFARSFVRPGGLDVPAAPAAVDAVERTAATIVKRRRRPLVLGPLLVALTPLAMLSSWLADRRRASQKRNKTAKALKARSGQLRKEDRVRAATEVWREREERLEAKHEAKAIERAERARLREQKQESREKKRRLHDLARAVRVATPKAKPVDERKQVRREGKAQTRVAKQHAREEAKAQKASRPPLDDLELQARKEQKEQSRAAKQQAREEAEAQRAQKASKPAPDEQELQARREEKEQIRAAKQQAREEAEAAKAAGRPGPNEEELQARREEKEQTRAAKEQAREEAEAAKAAGRPAPDEQELQARKEQKEQSRAAKEQAREEAEAAKAAGRPGPNEEELQARKDQKEQSRAAKQHAREEAQAAKAAGKPTPDEQELQARKEQKEQTRAAKQQAREEAKAAKAASRPTPDEQELQARREEKEQTRAAKQQAREEAQKAKAEKDGAAARSAAKQERHDERQLRAGKKKAAKAAARARKRRKTLLRATRRRWKTVKRGVRGTYNTRYRHTYRSTLARVPSRDELPVLLNARGLTGRGAEIGVRDGRYSDRLLETWKGDLLISIDPWLSADPDDYVDASNVAQDEMDALYLETQMRLARHGARSEIWRATSIEAAAMLPDRSLDFAYIDARHDYASVLEDLAAWFPKVKPGGILAGHDYADIDFGRTEFGVKSAVDEFFEARSIPVYSTDGPSAVEMLPTWIVEIPVEGGYHQNGGGEVSITKTTETA